MRWVAHVAHTVRCFIQNVNLKNLKGRRPLGRCKHRWKDSIEIDLKEVEREVVEWIHLTQGPVAERW
jgi:hypothetical protein